MSILPKFSSSNDVQKKASSERQLIKFESQFGRHIFGPIPKNTRRDFFCLDANTWVWHEEWKDENGQDQVTSTRYVIRPDGAIKSRNGQSYQRVEEEESKNLYLAANKYIALARAEYASILSA